MNEATTFHCPACSAPLEIPEGDVSVRCPYCGNTVIPPGARPAAHPLQANGDYAQFSVVVTSGAAIDFQEYRDLLAQGQKEEAVKRLHQASGLGLKKSQEIMDALERGEDSTAVSALLGGLLPAQTADDLVQVISLDQSATQRIAGKRLVKAAGIAGTSITCGMFALFGFIFLATVVPIMFALIQGGGPLAPVWNKVDPLSPVGIELRFGEEGIAAGQLNDPRAIAADDDGNIYVADFSSGRLQSFDTNGKFRWLVNLGDETYVQALDVARDGALLVVARGKLRRFDRSDGAELPSPTLPEDYYFEDVAVAADGRIAAIVDSEDILVLDPAYQQVLFVSQAVSSISGDSELESDIEIDGLGNLYVLGMFNYGVFKYTPEGRFANRFASQGDEPGQLTAPGDLAIDGQGRLYVSDFNGVQIFDADGRYLDKFDLGGYVFGLNFDLQDRLYTVSNEPQVMRLRNER